MIAMQLVPSSSGQGMVLHMKVHTFMHMDTKLWASPMLTCVDGTRCSVKSFMSSKIMKARSSAQLAAQ
jgi:hypothetical protein